jgi:hypothetical protein
MSGSARCCSSFPLFHRMIKKGSNTTVPLSLFLRSIREEDAQVACICIPSIYMHILHILHIFASRLDWKGELGDGLWAQEQQASAVCFAHNIHLVQAPIGSSWGHWNHPFQHAGRGCRLWWWVLWLEAWGGWWKPMVVRKLLGNVLVVQDVGLKKIKYWDLNCEIWEYVQICNNMQFIELYAITINICTKIPKYALPTLLSKMVIIFKKNGCSPIFIPRLFRERHPKATPQGRCHSACWTR